eukprot:EG_transcript_25254
MQWLAEVDHIRCRWNEEVALMRDHQLVEWRDLRMRQLQDVLEAVAGGADSEMLGLLRAAHREEAELVREQHRGLAASLLEDKEAEVTQAEGAAEASGVSPESLELFRTADTVHLAYAAFECIQQRRRETCTRLTAQNAQLQAQLLDKLQGLPRCETTVQSLQEYAQLSATLEEHNEHLRQIQKSLHVGRSSKRERHAAVVEDCCDQLDAARSDCAALRRQLLAAELEPGLRTLLESHSQQAA